MLGEYYQLTKELKYYQSANLFVGASCLQLRLPFMWVYWNYYWGRLALSTDDSTSFCTVSHGAPHLPGFFRVRLGRPHQLQQPYVLLVPGRVARQRQAL